MTKPGIVIPIDKPLQWTSFQVVNKLKWHIKRTFGIKKFKIGHAGTLDPLASGLLLVCVGSATKRIEELQSGIKTYSGTMVLGATTPCYDLEQPIDHYYPFEHLTRDAIENARQQFLGETDQVPPMFSAVKIDGKRAYVSARDGKVADIAPKKVTIHNFEITAYREGTMLESLADSAEIMNTSVKTPPVCNETQSRRPNTMLYKNPLGEVPPHLPQLDFRITCGKGTYIRSIARDMGEKLGTGAFLCALRRERIGNYSIGDALQMDDIETTITPDNPEYESITSLKLN